MVDKGLRPRADPGRELRVHAALFSESREELQVAADGGTLAGDREVTIAGSSTDQIRATAAREPGAEFSAMPTLQDRHTLAAHEQPEY